MNSRELFMLAVVISQPSACSSTAPYFEAASEAGFPETVRLFAVAGYHNVTITAR